MRKLITFFFLVVFTLTFSGCTTQLNSTLQPGINLAKITKYYVIHLKQDKRNLHKIISNELNSLGKVSTYGEEESIPDDIDAIVRYVDNWQWDITNYMIKITISIRDKDEGFIAQGTSFRTSMARKSPPEMIRETLIEIFNKGEKSGTATN